MSIPLNRQTIEAVQMEVLRSVRLWADKAMMNPALPDGKRLAILIEEVGEVAKALNEDMSADELIKELDQVAAMALSWRQVERMRLDDATIGPDDSVPEM